ncbi:hypothetical protein BDZ97DRAFT_1812387 [Flammula alnicola]|nr:hypothetical protein BDZ97DRAFT_1812387 [Flammula alnicola]
MDIREVRILCHADNVGERTALSLLVMLEDPTALRRLSEGVFLYSTHCRISQYRPRKLKTHSSP